MSFSHSDISRVEIIGLESLKRDDIMIAVIGPTGSGKSRFIQQAWGIDSDLGVGQGLEPFTKEVITYRFTFTASAKRENVVLFDTPGLDSTGRLDLKVLDGICKLFRKPISLVGILHMLDVSIDPVPGTALRYLDHFKWLCGEEGLSRVFLVTSMWGAEHEESTRSEREAELKEGYWNGMLSYESPICNFINSRQSAWDILNSLVDRWNKSEAPYQNIRSQPQASQLVKTLVPSSKHAYHFNRGACFSALLEVMNSSDRKKRLCELRGGEAQLVIDYLHLELSQSYPADNRYDQLLSLLCELTLSTNLFPQSFTLKEIYRMKQKAEGGFADVYKGVYLGSRQLVAVAVKIPKDQSCARHLKEFTTWAYLSHPNILPFYGVFECPQKKTICLVSPWMDNGNMYEYCVRHCPVEAVRLQLLLDVIEGLLYLHERDIVHGDIKGANILISHDRRALIADFGMDGSESAKSVRWAAPERFQADDILKPSDVWSFGCLVYEIMSRRIPYDTCVLDDFVPLLLSKQKLPKRPTGDDKSDAIPENSVAWSLFRHCMVFDYARRPTCRDVQEYFTGLLEATGISKQRSKETVTPTASPLSPSNVKTSTEFDFSRIYILLFSVSSSSPIDFHSQVLERDSGLKQPGRHNSL